MALSRAFFITALLVVFTSSTQAAGSDNESDDVPNELACLQYSFCLEDGELQRADNCYNEALSENFSFEGHIMSLRNPLCDKAAADLMDYKILLGKDEATLVMKKHFPAHMSNDDKMRYEAFKYCTMNLISQCYRSGIPEEANLKPKKVQSKKEKQEKPQPSILGDVENLLGDIL